MLKSISRITELVRKRFASRYAQAVAAEAMDYEEPLGTSWPYDIALGHLSKRELVENIESLVLYASELQEFAARHGVQISYDNRVAGGMQRIPSHVTIPSLDAAASVCGSEAKAQIACARERAMMIVREFPECGFDAVVQVLRKSKGMDSADFELVMRAARWFSEHEVSGLTARQVPLEGFHAKWLDGQGHRSMIKLLVGTESLGLSTRPAQVEFAYLDPSYLSTGSRRYDAWVIGDNWSLPYAPTNVIIVENKDTYLGFPALDGGICVFGAGNAGIANVPKLPWIALVDQLFYWGDMDAAGLEILDAYREAGLNVASVLMDIDAYGRFERYGTSLSAGKELLEDHAALRLANLTPKERELYDLLTSSKCSTSRRIEQERIPLETARDLIVDAARHSDVHVILSEASP